MRHAPCFVPILATAATLAACASPPRAPSLEPLDVRAEHPVEYRASLRGPLTLDAPSDSRPAKSDRTIQVNLLLLEVDAGDAARLLERERVVPSAWTVSRREVADRMPVLRDGRRATMLSSPKMIVREGQSGSMMVMDEVAYVADFELEVEGDRAVADPVVETCQDGLLFAVRGQLDGEKVALDCSLVSNRLERPIPTVAVRFPGATHPVSVQTPLVLSQRIATRATIAPDECLVLAAYSGNDPSRPVLAFVTAKLVPREFAAR